jgi:hypothetical protein
MLPEKSHQNFFTKKSYPKFSFQKIQQITLKVHLPHSKSIQGGKQVSKARFIPPEIIRFMSPHCQ